MASGRRYDCVRTIVLWKGWKQGRSHSRPTFTKRYITILILHPRVPLTHLCVPHASVVTFPALSLCNRTVIRHTGCRNAVFWTFLKNMASLHENRNSAKSTNASDFGRSTCTSLIDTLIDNRCRKPLHTIHRSWTLVEAHKVRKSRTVEPCLLCK